MAVLQQQRQQQHVGGPGGSSKLSPSHLGGSGPKMSMSDPLSHPGLAGSVADLHQKTQGTYSGESFFILKSPIRVSCMLGTWCSCVFVTCRFLSYCVLKGLGLEWAFLVWSWVQWLVAQLGLKTVGGSSLVSSGWWKGIPQPPHLLIVFFIKMVKYLWGYANKCEMSGTALKVTESSCLVSLIYRSHCCSSQNERWFPIFPVWDDGRWGFGCASTRSIRSLAQKSWKQDGCQDRHIQLASR